MADVYTQDGEELECDIFDGTVSVPANWYVGWGTDGTTADKADSALGTEAAEARVAATLSQPSADVNRLVATITSESGQTITEVGVFSASTSGVLLIHSDFSGIAVGIGDAIEFTVDFERT